MLKNPTKRANAIKLVELSDVIQGTILDKEQSSGQKRAK